MKLAYIERGGFMLHLYAGHHDYPLEQNPRWHWGYALRVRGRYVLFGGRR